ncbi:MAG: CvpA family protein [Myxococcota bacterium]
MELDALSLVILAAFAALGAVRGSLRSGVRLGCWVFGNLGAFLGASWVAPLLELAGLGKPFSLVFAGIGILVAVGILGTVVVRLVETHFGVERRRTDGFGGAAFGLLQGGLVVLLLGWMGLWLEAAEQAGATLPVSAPAGSIVSRAAGSVAGAAVELFIGQSDPGARVAGRFAADPAAAVNMIQKLTENPRITALGQDSAFWMYVRAGSLDTALNQGSFLGIAHDETLRHELADLGLIQQTAASNPFQFRQEIRGILALVGPRMQELAEDPELQDLAQDPRVREALEQGDTLTLLRDPKVQRAVSDLLAP